MAMGQAAGTAAALAAKRNSQPRAVTAATLREQLLGDGALFEPLAPAAA
jgi:hypothetical protein